MDRKDTELEATGAKELSHSETETDPRTEALLEQGGDLFERGLLEEAIHLWTRVLFLDRGNREARRRIDQAKGLLAERQRLLDARVVDARRLFDGGEVEEARALLRSVLNVDSHHADALRLSEDLTAFDHRVGGGETFALEDLDAASEAPARQLGAAADLEVEAPADESRPTTLVPTSAPGGGLLVRVARRGGRATVSPPASPVKVAAFILVVGIAVTTAGLFLYYNWESIVSDGTAPRNAVSGGRASGAGGAEALATEPRGPAAPDLSELRYYNGARLFEEGRLREALAELERVDRGSSVASRARGLMLRIEERLLRGAEEPDTEDEEQ